jgi:hypothetical protein
VVKNPLMAERIDTPPAVEEQLGSALLIECFRIGNTIAILTRENIALASDSSNYRWHLSLAHPERRPTELEVEVGRRLLPDDEHFVVVFPASGWPHQYPNQIDFWQLGDPTLQAKIEGDSAAWRQ